MVIGGAGYVGSHAAKALAGRGHAPVVLDNLSMGHRSFVRWGPFRHADIRDSEALDAAFRAHRFDAVMHFAALAYVGESVVSPGKYYDVNIGGTRAVLEAMARAGVKNIVFSSSCAVYGEPETPLISETTPLAPVNPYGVTKMVCERMIADFGAAYGLQAVCLRYFNAAGGDPKLEIGEDHTPETHLIPLVLDAALGRIPEFSIFGGDYPTPDGTAVRDLIHVCDLAEAHVLALDHLLAGGGSATLNLGTGAGVSVAQTVATAAAVTGRVIPTRRAARRPGDPASLVADPRRAFETLRWKPARSDVSTVLADAWAWRRARFGAAR